MNLDITDILDNQPQYKLPTKQDILTRARTNPIVYTYLKTRLQNSEISYEQCLMLMVIEMDKQINELGAIYRNCLEYSRK